MQKIINTELTNSGKIIKSSLAKRNFHKFFSNRLALTGLSIIMIFILGAIFAPLLSKYDPSYVDMSIRYLPPSAEHWIGTDGIGRDVMTRILYGGRISILVGVVSALGASFIGVILGCIAGYFGRKIDNAILYISEVFMTFPSILLVMIIVGFVGHGLMNLIIIFSLTGWAGTMRIVRGNILSLREEAFVESCRANSISKKSIMFKHMLPNTLGPVIVTTTLATGGFVLQEAALSFLGLGIDTSIATWGNMINSAKSLDVIQNYPNLWISPGIVICLFALGINFFGDGLRDVFDPKQ